MMNKCWVLGILLLNMNYYVGAAGNATLITNESSSQGVALINHHQASAAKRLKGESKTIQTAPTVHGSNLDGIDSNTADLTEIKRKLEIAKANAELQKIKGGGSRAANISKINSDDAQTTVTGVAINQEGKKIAWLQFADGGSLTVNVGSRVGTYTVSDITMTGVKLAEGKRSVFLKRAYYAPEKTKVGGGASHLGFTPSPIITNANSNDMVPPIVPIR